MQEINLPLYQVIIHELGHLITDVYISEIHPTFIKILYVEFRYKTVVNYEWSAIVKIDEKYNDKINNSREYYSLIVEDDEFFLLNFISLASGCIFQELVTNLFFRTNQIYKDCLNLSSEALGQRDARIIEILKSEHRVQFKYDYLSNTNLACFFEKFVDQFYEFLKAHFTLMEKGLRKISDKIYKEILNNFQKNPNEGFIFTIESSLLQDYLIEIAKMMHSSGFYAKLNDFYMNILIEYQILMKTVR